jgi:cellulose biosynthesis protein BcsQ
MAVASEVGNTAPQAVTQLDDDWEYVLVDCPPTLGFLSIAALVACQAILVPVEIRVMVLGGLAALIRRIDRVRELLNLEPAPVGNPRVPSRPAHQSLASDPHALARASWRPGAPELLASFVLPVLVLPTRVPRIDLNPY